ncbi:hypothetical protein CFIICLFH_2924 [Methylobacterium goesingense]|nr:hypothetical protein CFIICLFH_2924 [Methylobacterium goesingense]
MQAEVAVEAGAHRLRDDFTRGVLREAIDHDPVEAGQRPHLPDGLAAERLEPGRLLEAGDHAAHKVAGTEVLRRAGFGLDDDGAARKVQGYVEQGLVQQQPDPEHPVDGIGAAQGLKVTPQDVEGLAVDELVQRHAEHRLDGTPQPLRCIRARPRHDPVRGHGQQEAEALDGPEDVDRLAVARVQVDGCRGLAVNRLGHVLGGLGHANRRSARHASSSEAFTANPWRSMQRKCGDARSVEALSIGTRT